MSARNQRKKALLREALQRCARTRTGSFALEAALVVPVFLVILLFLVSTILSVRAEMRLKTAADRTAAEIALLPPIIFSLIDEDQLQIPIAALFEKADKDSEAASEGEKGRAMAILPEFINPSELETIVNDAVFDLTSSVAFGRLVRARIRYWQERLGSFRLTTSPAVFLDWNLKDDQLYLEVYYELRTLTGNIPRHVTAFVPVWRPAQPEQSKPNGKSVWQLDNFSRGQKLREKYGGNLPGNYPVIARFENGEALAIKSMDLTKPSYDDPEQVIRKIAVQIEEVARFSGTAKPYGKDKVWIQSADIQTRRLLLVVPTDSDFGKYNYALTELTRQARSQGVAFEIVSFECSKAP